MWLRALRAFGQGPTTTATTAGPTMPRARVRAWRGAAVGAVRTGESRAMASSVGMRTVRAAGPASVHPGTRPTTRPRSCPTTPTTTYAVLVQGGRGDVGASRLTGVAAAAGRRGWEYVRVCGVCVCGGGSGVAGDAQALLELSERIGPAKPPGLTPSQLSRLPSWIRPSNAAVASYAATARGRTGPQGRRG